MTRRKSPEERGGRVDKFFEKYYRKFRGKSRRTVKFTGMGLPGREDSSTE